MYDYCSYSRYRMLLEMLMLCIDDVASLLTT